MGSFYTNYTLKGPSQQAVARALAGRTALVTPEQDGCVVAFDEESDQQDQEVISGLALRLSKELRCPVLAVLNHDDDIFWYQLYLNGQLADEYDSSPGYFDSDAAPSEPVGGNTQVLCSAFGANAPEQVEQILRKSAFDEDGYAFAGDRHADLVDALGSSTFAVCAGYNSISEGELPEGLDEDGLLEA
jgi:hypothetical protein